MKSLRDIPSVDVILQNPHADVWISGFGRPLTIQAIRQVLEEARTTFKHKQSLPTLEEIYEQVEAHLSAWSASSLIPVINASGVVLHTNLGTHQLVRQPSRPLNQSPWDIPTWNMIWIKDNAVHG
jgi:L-seryl-tRNA(Ser) seleniumtransferase